MRWLAAIGAFLALLVSSRGQTPEVLFNGHDLSGWSGDPRIWSVRDGAMHGESTLTAPVLTNTFLIWKGEPPKDFALQVKVRLRNGNSGIQYRSRDLGKWMVAGYQAEIANEPGSAGFLYEERGRKFLAYLGEAVRIAFSGRRTVEWRIADKPTFLQWAYYRPGEWNDYLIVAKGAYLAHYVNGFQTIALVDEDSDRRSADGVIAFQVHAGLPMAVDLKDLLLLRL